MATPPKQCDLCKGKLHNIWACESKCSNCGELVPYWAKGRKSKDEDNCYTCEKCDTRTCQVCGLGYDNWYHKLLIVSEKLFEVISREPLRGDRICSLIAMIIFSPLVMVFCCMAIAIIVL